MILLHPQPGKCQSAMREESRSLKWQDWRFPSPLTQLGWVPLYIVSIQPLLAICLSMISQTLRDDSGWDHSGRQCSHHHLQNTGRLGAFAPSNDHNFKAHQAFSWIMVVLQLWLSVCHWGRGVKVLMPHDYKVCGWLTNCLRCIMLVYMFLS